jgi:hypothetical protein
MADDIGHGQWCSRCMQYREQKDRNTDRKKKKKKKRRHTYVPVGDVVRAIPKVCTSACEEVRQERVVQRARQSNHTCKCDQFQSGVSCML